MRSSLTYLLTILPGLLHPALAQHGVSRTESRPKGCLRVCVVCGLSRSKIPSPSASPCGVLLPGCQCVKSTTHYTRTVQLKTVKDTSDGYHPRAASVTAEFDQMKLNGELCVHAHANTAHCAHVVKPQQGCASPINCRRPAAATVGCRCARLQHLTQVTAQLATRCGVGFTARAAGLWPWRAGCRARRLCRGGTLGALARLGSGSHRGRRRCRSRHRRSRRHRACPSPRNKLRLPVRLIT